MRAKKLSAVLAATMLVGYNLKGAEARWWEIFGKDEDDVKPADDNSKFVAEEMVVHRDGKNGDLVFQPEKIELTEQRALLEYYN